MNAPIYGLAKIGKAWMIMNLKTGKTYRENGQEWSHSNKAKAAEKLYYVTIAEREGQ